VTADLKLTMYDTPRRTPRWKRLTCPPDTGDPRIAVGRRQRPYPSFAELNPQSEVSFLRDGCFETSSCVWSDTGLFLAARQTWVEQGEKERD
jgi:hypothetical protein